MSHSFRRTMVSGATLLAAAIVLAGCLSPYEGRRSVCDGNDPNSPGWPYCHGAEPGGSQPVDSPNRL